MFPLIGTIFVGAAILFASAIVWSIVKNKRTVYCRHHPDLGGRVAIVTGANTGIGKETARELAKRGARVILACRNVEKGTSAADDIRASVDGADVIVKRVDLSSLKSVKEFADDVRSTERCVDMLINNAGVVASEIPYTEDGLEMTFASNHLGHFLLTRLLLDLVEKSEMKRIVVVSSVAYKMGRIEFDEDDELKHNKFAIKQYGATKLMNCLFVQELSRRVRSKGISVFSLMPGKVRTEFGRGMKTSVINTIFYYIVQLSLFFGKTPVEGCQTTVYCAIAPDIEHLSGSYFVECEPEPLLPIARDFDLANRLWQYSERKVEHFLPSTEY